MLFLALSYSREPAQGTCPGVSRHCWSVLLRPRRQSPEPGSQFPQDWGAGPCSARYSQLKFCLCPLQAPGGSGLCQRESPRHVPPCHAFPERCPYLQLLCGFLPLAEPAQEVRKPRLPGQRRVPPVLLAVWPWEATLPF